MKRLRILQTVCLLAFLLMLAACTQDELTEGNVTSLPKGMYPLTLTATQGEVVASLQTRVSDYEEGDNHKSKWTINDQIRVVVSEGGNAAETTCTLDENGNITNYSPQLYWKTTQSSKINAWYSNITGQNTTSNTVSITDQSKGLAHVLKADEMTSINYKNKNISLNFKHQLAKVRVKLTAGTYTGNLNSATVNAKGYTTCTVINGTVSGSDEGYIPMHKNSEYYEVNLIPGTKLKDAAFEISANGKTAKANLTNEITLAAENVYTLIITMNAAGPEKVTEGETITKSGDYIMQGTFTQGVTLNGDNIKLTLDGVTANIGNAIKVTGGSPTLIVKGTNNSFKRQQADH